MGCACIWRAATVTAAGFTRTGAGSGAGSVFRTVCRNGSSIGLSLSLFALSLWLTFRFLAPRAPYGSGVVRCALLLKVYAALQCTQREYQPLFGVGELHATQSQGCAIHRLPVYSCRSSESEALSVMYALMAQL